MSRLKESKNVYDNIPIPDRLEETVASAIEQAAARRKEEMAYRTSRQWIAGTGKNGEGGAE